MNRTRTTLVSRRLLVFAAFTVFHATIKANEPLASTNRAIDGIIARSAAIYSARLDYTYQSDIQNEVTTSLEFAIEGDDWRVGYANSPNFQMNRNEIGFMFANAAPGRATDVQATLSIGSTMTHDQLINANLQQLGSRLGTLWYRIQSEFLDTNRDDVEMIATEVVDGYPCVVLQWSVRPKDFRRAFVELPPAIARQRRGLLRLYASESLGWAIPLTEYRTPQDKVVARCSARDFREVGAGIHFPQACNVTFHDDTGPFTTRFELSNIDSVNESLPSSTFEMRIPKGTLVTDSRPGMAQATFALESQDQFRGLNVALGKGAAVATQTAKMRLYVVNVVVGGLLAIAWYWRRRTIKLASPTTTMA